MKGKKNDGLNTRLLCILLLIALSTTFGLSACNKKTKQNPSSNIPQDSNLHNYGEISTTITNATGFHPWETGQTNNNGNDWRPTNGGGHVDGGTPSSNNNNGGGSGGVDKIPSKPTIPTVPETEEIIDKKWYQGIDISKNSLFNPENVAIAINDTVKNMKEGEKAYLPYGSYKYTQTIKLQNSHNLKKCTIVLDGIYAQPKKSDFDAMHVSGDNLTLKINKITNNYLSNHYPTKRASGITIFESKSCNYDFGQIVGFEYGLNFMPNKSGKSIENNKIAFRYIGDCKYPLYIQAASGANASVNKNNFTGGRVRGYTGVTARKGNAQTKAHAENTFDTISWESIETTGIDLQYVSNTSFFAPRFESVMGINIVEGANCTGSTYSNAVDLPFDKIQIASKNTTLNMPLYRVDPNSEWQGVIKSMKTDSAGRITYEFYEQSFETVSNSSKTLDLNCMNVSVVAKNAPVTLTLHKLSAFYGAELWVYVNDASKAVNIVASNNSTIASNLDKGTYKITYTNSWQVSKVSSDGIL